jgi:hypothetical protein
MCLYSTIKTGVCQEEMQLYTEKPQLVFNYRADFRKRCGNSEKSLKNGDNPRRNAPKSLEIGVTA